MLPFTRAVSTDDIAPSARVRPALRATFRRPHEQVSIHHRRNGVPVEYIVFADEGHGFSKKKNSMEANRKIHEFLEKYLKKS